MRYRTTAAVALAAAVGFGGVGPARAADGVQAPAKDPVAYGSGGGAATMSADATAAAIRILQRGGNAVDGAVAAAAALGVSEPFVAGPGGGGFFLYYRARDHKVFTIDGREKAPAGANEKYFIDPATGKPLPFNTAVESGLSVGVPGQVATWGVAEDRFGRLGFRKSLLPAQQLAANGFQIDRALVGAIKNQQRKLERFQGSAELFMPGGEIPRVRQTLTNPELANTYALLRRNGWRWFYTGPIARDIAETVQDPQETDPADQVAGGKMTAQDLADYTAPLRDPAVWDYRGYTLYGMAPPSSGGTTIGEAMNILETFDLASDFPTIDGLFRYIEALKLAFADRNEWVGDPDQVTVPTTGLLSDAFAQQRASLITDTALPTPVEAGDPRPFDGGSVRAFQTSDADHGGHTNHLVVADRQGNVVSYTNTIEQIAGSGISVRGFLLNNELTDFNFDPGTANSPASGKRPRSSMSPTIITKGDRVIEAIGSPGGATIITTVLQTIINQIDFGMSLHEAIEAPRASSRNGASVDAEPAFIDQFGADLQARGETFAPCCAGSAGQPRYIGIAAGLVLLPGNRLLTATEAWRGGGGSAMVVRPANQIPSAVAEGSVFKRR